MAEFSAESIRQISRLATNSLRIGTGNFLSQTGNFWSGTGNLRSPLPGARRSRAIAHLPGRTGWRARGFSGCRRVPTHEIGPIITPRLTTKHPETIRPCLFETGLEGAVLEDGRRGDQVRMDPRCGLDRLVDAGADGGTGQIVAGDEQAGPAGLESVECGSSKPDPANPC